MTTTATNHNNHHDEAEAKTMTDTGQQSHQNGDSNNHHDVDEKINDDQEILSNTGLKAPTQLTIDPHTSPLPTHNTIQSYPYNPSNPTSSPPIVDPTTGYVLSTIEEWMISEIYANDKNRAQILRIDAEMMQFLTDPQQPPHLELMELTSYARLIWHRLSDRAQCLHRAVDMPSPTGQMQRAVSVQRTKNTLIPQFTIAQLMLMFPPSPQSSPEPNDGAPTDADQANDSDAPVSKTPVAGPNGKISMLKRDRQQHHHRHSEKGMNGHHISPTQRGSVASTVTTTASSDTATHSSGDLSSVANGINESALDDEARMKLREEEYEALRAKIFNEQLQQLEHRAASTGQSAGEISAEERKQQAMQKTVELLTKMAYQSQSGISKAYIEEAGQQNQYQQQQDAHLYDRRSYAPQNNHRNSHSHNRHQQQASPYLQPHQQQSYMQYPRQMMYPNQQQQHPNSILSPSNARFAMPQFASTTSAPQFQYMPPQSPYGAVDQTQQQIMQLQQQLLQMQLQQQQQQQRQSFTSPVGYYDLTAAANTYMPQLQPHQTSQPIQLPNYPMPYAAFQPPQQSAPFSTQFAPPTPQSLAAAYGQAPSAYSSPYAMLSPESHQSSPMPPNRRQSHSQQSYGSNNNKRPPQPRKHGSMMVQSPHNGNNNNGYNYNQQPFNRRQSHTPLPTVDTMSIASSEDFTKNYSGHQMHNQMISPSSNLQRQQQQQSGKQRRGNKQNKQDQQRQHNGSNDQSLESATTSPQPLIAGHIPSSLSELNQDSTTASQMSNSVQSDEQHATANGHPTNAEHRNHSKDRSPHLATRPRKGTIGEDSAHHQRSRSLGSEQQMQQLFANDTNSFPPLLSQPVASSDSNGTATPGQTSQESQQSKPSFLSIAESSKNLPQTKSINTSASPAPASEQPNSATSSRAPSHRRDDSRTSISSAFSDSYYSKQSSAPPSSAAPAASAASPQLKASSPWLTAAAALAKVPAADLRAPLRATPSPSLPSTGSSSPVVTATQHRRAPSSDSAASVDSKASSRRTAASSGKSDAAGSAKPSAEVPKPAPSSKATTTVATPPTIKWGSGKGLDLSSLTQPFNAKKAATTVGKPPMAATPSTSAPSPSAKQT